jgi:hypothetical protein
MKSPILPPPLGSNWKTWAERLNSFLTRNLGTMASKTNGSVASEDGIFLWDRELEQPVISVRGEFVPVRYGRGDCLLAYTTATHSAAAINTAYAITWDNSAMSKNIAIDPVNANRIVFAKSGRYKIQFSAEIQSGSSSSKTIYIFPAISGVDIPFSTIVHSLKGTGESHTVTRSGMFDVNAGDYLESKFAVTDTSLSIKGSAATAFSPAAPSAVLIVTEVDI